MGIVNTVLGPCNPGSLGMTLMHEHLTFAIGPQVTVTSCHEAALWTIQALCRFREAGGATIVEVTGIGMGRDARALSDISRNSGINVIAATGFYFEPFLPPDLDSMSVDAVASLFVGDLTEGIGGTGVKAGVIGEIGTSDGVVTERERKVFLAASLAHHATGAPILTHTTNGTMCLEQLDLLEERGVPPSSIIVGHCDMGHPLSVLVEAARRGAMLACDTIGKQRWRTYDGRILHRPDSSRASLIAALLERGFEDQIVLSSDILPIRGEPTLNPETFGQWGYSYVPVAFAEELQRCGVKAGTVRKMLVENPRQVLVPRSI